MTERSNNGNDPLVICVLGLGGGGFHFEVECLVRQIGVPVQAVLVYAIESHVANTWACPVPVRDVYVVRSPSMRDDSRWRKLTAMAVAVWRAFWILLKTRPDCIIAVGTAHAIPFGAAGRLLGVPTYFVESITRVKQESHTGRLVRRFRLARWQRVQWQSLATSLGDEFNGSLLE